MTSEAAILAAPAALAAALAIVTLERGRRRAHYVFKPATMAIVLAIPLSRLAEGESIGLYGSLVIVGLCLSLVGDVLLMFETEYFVAGLVFFLLAHLVYIGAFGAEIARDGAWSARWGVLVLPLVALVGFAIVMVRAMRPGLGRLVAPVTAYVCVIAVMGWLALGLWLVHPDERSQLVALGAVLFMTSDAVLALDRFRKRIRFAQPILLATYFAAQWCFAASV